LQAVSFGASNVPNLPQRLRDALWPVGAEAGAKDEIARLVVLGLIALIMGPDLLAAIEMRMLLEILGTTLFLLAFGAGARLLVLLLWRQVRAAVLPPEFLALVRGRNPLAAPVIAGFWLVSNRQFATLCLIVLIPYVCIRELMRAAAG
jgi:hypothetical protein